MPDALIVQIANAAVNRLNAATLSLPFVAERRYIPLRGKQEIPEDELAELRVSVVGTALVCTPLTRNSDDFTYVLDIGIQQRVLNTPEEIDPLMFLSEEILDLFRVSGLDAVPGVKLTEIINEPIYHPPWLSEHSLFTSIVRVTYKMQRGRIA